MSDDRQKDAQIAYLQGQVDALKANKGQLPANQPKKGAGCLSVILVCFGIVVVIGAIGAAMSGGKSTEATSNATATDDAPPPPDNPPLTKAQAHARNVAEARTFYNAVLDAGRECDKDGKYAAQAIKAGDVVNLYQNADAAYMNCAHASGQIKDLPLPVHASVDVKAKMKAARQELASGYGTRSYFFSQVKDAADKGHLRPSEALEIRKWGAAGAYGQLKGLVGVLGAFESEGVSGKDLNSRKSKTASDD